jgi:hypothetical protein
MEDEFSVDATVQLVENLLEELGRTDPASREIAEELVGSLMRLYGVALGRIMDVLREIGTEGVTARLAEDRLLASLMLLHGLHPVDTETRVRTALHRLERGLESHRLELAGIVDGVARITVVRNGSGSPPATLTGSIEHALTECAPDLSGVQVEGIATASLVQIAPAAT